VLALQKLATVVLVVIFAAVRVRIKLLHTVVWLFFAGCIVAIPVAGARGHYLWAAAALTHRHG